MILLRQKVLPALSKTKDPSLQYTLHPLINYEIYIKNRSCHELIVFQIHKILPGRNRRVHVFFFFFFFVSYFFTMGNFWGWPCSSHNRRARLRSSSMTSLPSTPCCGRSPSKPRHVILSGNRTGHCHFPLAAAQRAHKCRQNFEKYCPTAAPFGNGPLPRVSLTS